MAGPPRPSVEFSPHQVAFHIFHNRKRPFLGAVGLINKGNNVKLEERNNGCGLFICLRLKRKGSGFVVYVLSYDIIASISNIYLKLETSEMCVFTNIANGLSLYVQ